MSHRHDEEFASTSAPVIEHANVSAEIQVAEGAKIAGVTIAKGSAWCVDMARGELVQVDLRSGERVGALEGFPMDAGTAFDGESLWQIGDRTIYKVDPSSGQILHRIPTPDGEASGMAWAEGALWVGAHRGKRIRKVDPETGEVLRTIDCDHFVTGVSWVEGELWHGSHDVERWDQAGALIRLQPEDGKTLRKLVLPPGRGCSGLEADGEGRLWCGNHPAGRVFAVERHAQGERAG